MLTGTYVNKIEVKSNWNDTNIETSFHLASIFPDKFFFIGDRFLGHLHLILSR
jgi:hypothetical protein